VLDHCNSDDTLASFLKSATGIKLSMFNLTPATGGIENLVPKNMTLTSYWYQSIDTDNWRQKTVKCVHIKVPFFHEHLMADQIYL